MNCFFVSCEIVKDPSLKGKICAVGPKRFDKKGVISASSYEARKVGVRAGMSVVEALRNYPDLIIIEPDFSLYQRLSNTFFEYLLKITPLVEPASIDEGYIDVTDCVLDLDYIKLAEKIQKELLERYNLPCSIGIAPNKFLAKMASDMKKPLGITVLRKRDVKELLWPLPASDMMGVGKKTKEMLDALGIKTIKDLANYKNVQLLKELIGEVSANGLISHANGNGSNEINVNSFNDISSISCAQTFEQDEYSIENMKTLLKSLVNSICIRMEKRSLKAFNFRIQIKYFDFRVSSKSFTLMNPSSDSKRVYSVIESLFDDLYDPMYPVRLLGVAASKVIESTDELKQMSIFDSFEKEQKDHDIDQLIKSINKELGDNVIKRGF